jgi:hypothetical protein
MNKQAFNAIFLAVMLFMAAIIIYPMINEVHATGDKKKDKKESSEEENASLEESKNTMESSEDKTYYQDKYKTNNPPSSDHYGKDFLKYKGVYKDHFAQEEIKKVVCEDTGLFADSLENCPILCPKETLYEGFYVNNFKKCTENLYN